MARFDQVDEEWAIIAPRLPTCSRRPEREDDRNVLDAIFYVWRTVLAVCSVQNGTFLAEKLTHGPLETAH